MRKAILATIAAVIVIAGGWIGWQVYDASIRWGTSNPCQMIGQRLARLSVSDLDVAIRPERLADRERIAADFARVARDDGAVACWRSILFAQPLTIERVVADQRQAARIKRDWESGSPRLRRNAIATARQAGEGVREALGPDHPVWKAVEESPGSD